MTLADSSDAAAAQRDIPLPDEAATLALGRAIGRVLSPGDVIHLYGDLGAGKTTLARGAIQAAAGATDIPSPTYNLVQIYAGSHFDLWHLDLYRLKSPDEAFELGLDDAVGRAVQLVEWPERLQGQGPAADLSVRLSPDGEDGRVAFLSAGPKWEKRLVAI